MIQRIQSVLLAVVALLMSGTLFLPLYTKTHPETTATATLTAWAMDIKNTNGPITSTSTAYLGILAALCIAISLVSIFSYTNRKRQLMFGFVNTLLIGGFIGTAFYLSGITVENAIPTQTLGERGVGFYLPLLALILNFSANRLIRNDEQLVRSMDRIR